MLECVAAEFPPTLDAMRETLTHHGEGFKKEEENKEGNDGEFGGEEFRR